MTEVACSSMGSSPHTRGALGEDNARDDPARIIPAYAGSTGDQWGQDRVRVGSSPHTRGARRGPGRRSPGPGIIPAYAGSTWYGGMRLALTTDHPRIRGEHKDQHTQSMIMFGSSPHTRGAPQLLGRPSQARRIIPAYAGSTSLPASPTLSAQDHPRIRGEHHRQNRSPRTQSGIIPAYAGSTRMRRILSAYGIRIIPAYAGSTPANVRRHDPRQDHPRIRGEHRRVARRCMAENGSSPHTRGALHAEHCAVRIGGIIPAYAGSTVRRAYRRHSEADHPRIRGEHPWFIDSRGWLAGSSPHTRGAHLEIPAIPRIAAVIIPVFLYPSPTPQEEADRSMVLLTLS